MSTRGIYTFKGYGETYHVYVHFDNYPAGAQQHFEKTLGSGKVWQLHRYEPDEFAAGFIAAVKESGGNVRLSRSRYAAADVEYGYTVSPQKETGRLLLVVTSTDFWENQKAEKKLWSGYLSDFTPQVAKGL